MRFSDKPVSDKPGVTVYARSVTVDGGRRMHALYYGVGPIGLCMEDETVRIACSGFTSRSPFVRPT